MLRAPMMGLVMPGWLATQARASVVKDISFFSAIFPSLFTIAEDSLLMRFIGSLFE